jgi:hypothetical protein
MLGLSPSGGQYQVRRLDRDYAAKTAGPKEYYLANRMLLIQHADFRRSELACAQEVHCFALGDGTRESNSALRCPLTTRDLAGHYDPEAALHVCANCDGEQGTLTNHHPPEAYRRRKCPTVRNIFGTTQ